MKYHVNSLIKKIKEKTARSVKKIKDKRKVILQEKQERINTTEVSAKIRRGEMIEVLIRKASENPSFQKTIEERNEKQKEYINGVRGIEANKGNINLSEDWKELN